MGKPIWTNKIQILTINLGESPYLGVPAETPKYGLYDQFCHGKIDHELEFVTQKFETTVPNNKNK